MNIEVERDEKKFWVRIDNPSYLSTTNSPSFNRITFTMTKTELEQFIAFGNAELQDAEVTK